MLARDSQAFLSFFLFLGLCPEHRQDQLSFLPLPLKVTALLPGALGTWDQR